MRTAGKSQTNHSWSLLIKWRPHHCRLAWLTVERVLRIRARTFTPRRYLSPTYASATVGSADKGVVDVSLKPEGLYGAPPVVNTTVGCPPALGAAQCEGFAVLSSPDCTWHNATVAVSGTGGESLSRALALCFPWLLNPRHPSCPVIYTTTIPLPPATNLLTNQSTHSRTVADPGDVAWGWCDRRSNTCLLCKLAYCASNQRGRDPTRALARVRQQRGCARHCDLPARVSKHQEYKNIGQLSLSGCLRVS